MCAKNCVRKLVTRNVATPLERARRTPAVDSGDMVSNILETEFQRSVAQMNDTQYQFLQTSMAHTTAQCVWLECLMLVFPMAGEGG